VALTIGVDIKALRNGRTGIARYLGEILDRLQKIDTENSYVLFEFGPAVYTPANRLWKVVPFKAGIPGIVWQQLVLPFALKKHGVDVLWCPEQVCPLCSPTAAIVTTVYDLVFVHYPRTLAWSIALILRVFFPLTLRKTAIAAAISDHTRNDVLRTYPGLCKRAAVRTIACAGPLWRTPDGYEAGRRQDFLFYVGNYGPRKNLVNLVKALEILKTGGRDIPLHLAGPRTWKSGRAVGYIENSPARDNIRALGYLSDQDLKRQYLSCKALVYPSIFEGFGIPVLEALSLDCLVLTSKATVMEEIAGKAALYFDPRDPRSIADTIASVFAPSFDRSAVLAHRSAVLARYSWDRTAREMLEAFASARPRG